MDTIKKYAVGNGEIELTAADAEELRIILQTEYLEKTIRSVITENKECFFFRGPRELRHFVEEIVRINSDMINYDSSYYGEMLLENILLRATEHNLTR